MKFSDLVVVSKKEVAVGRKVAQTKEGPSSELVVDYGPSEGTNGSCSGSSAWLG
jgi:hypothetical protein